MSARGLQLRPKRLGIASVNHPNSSIPGFLDKYFGLVFFRNQDVKFTRISPFVELLTACVFWCLGCRRWLR